MNFAWEAHTMVISNTCTIPTVFNPLLQRDIHIYVQEVYALLSTVQSCLVFQQSPFNGKVFSAIS